MFPNKHAEYAAHLQLFDVESVAKLQNLIGKISSLPLKLQRKRIGQRCSLKP